MADTFMPARLNTFNQCYLRRIMEPVKGMMSPIMTFCLKLTYQAWVAFYCSCVSELLRWLKHASHMADGWISNDMLYGESTTGSRPVSRSSYIASVMFVKRHEVWQQRPALLGKHNLPLDLLEESHPRCNEGNS